MTTLKLPVRPEDHVQGDEHAAITLVEYGDYQCPHCGRAYPIVKRLQKHFGKQLRFVFRNFPLNEIHPQAETAAETAEFAGSEGKYWEMHDVLFENQSRFSPSFFEELAQRLGLTKNRNPEKIEQDLIELVPRKDWIEFPHLLIAHGRKVCKARRPLCEICVVEKLCPSSLLKPGNAPAKTKSKTSG